MRVACQTLRERQALFCLLHARLGALADFSPTSPCRSWDDKVSKWLPDFALFDTWANADVRVRDLCRCATRW